MPLITGLMGLEESDPHKQRSIRVKLTKRKFLRHYHASHQNYIFFILIVLNLISPLIGQSQFSWNDPPLYPAEIPFNSNFDDLPNTHYLTSIKSDVQRSCYDDQGKARRCVPPFENAAYLRQVEATNTCGEQPPFYRTEYCVQTPNRDQRLLECHNCTRGEHTANFLNDFHDNATQTSWQSETMYEGIGQTQVVNITLHLGKSYDVEYIRLLFNSPRPESLAIYKRENETMEWVPFQYFSGNCLDTFKIPESREVSESQPDKVLCTKEFSDISPLTGGNVIFSTLENRPSYISFDKNLDLQKFVTATDIKIVLIRPNTFGDEVFRDERVLKTYYYAISDLSVGGRCKCNGHASECMPYDNDIYGKLMCKCEHNTNGVNCERCHDLYNDQEWHVATFEDPHECQPCNCNNRASKCVFDADLFAETGHGGRCIDCIDNTDGPNCERCKEGFYENQGGRCVPCNCDLIGSVTPQCSRDGQCICKPGVTGAKCDRCAANYYDFSAQGCKPCDCNLAGSFNNTPQCHSTTGDCFCKLNVEGRTCDKCKPGFFDLQSTNEFGCLSCFCFGHSSVCESADDYSMHRIESNFYSNSERWSAIDKSGRSVQLAHNPSDHSISVQGAYGMDSVYFMAPSRFLGDQRASYNQFLRFNLKITEDNPGSSFTDITIEGAGLTLSQAIFGQGNPIPGRKQQSYAFRLHEADKFNWSPRLSAKDFIGVLANLTAIKIRGVYNYGGSGYIDEVALESAQRGANGLAATWIERCECPPGYDGQFCEQCKTGYRHDPPGGGSFAVCLPCQCNGYADFCDPYTGKCMCQNNTGGDNCEICARGYYGNPLDKTGCLQCPCLNNAGACVVLPDESIACLDCPQGYGGSLCDACIDGYYGSPVLNISCRKCDCSNNIDDNAVGNCDHVTGKCLKCIYNTGGDRCDKCLPGYYGDALAIPKGDCKDCGCHRAGTMMSVAEPGRAPLTLCDSRSGQCECKPNVMGRQCDRCIEGYWNIYGENGCQPCNCDIIGSVNQTCDEASGQCFCRPGIMGLKCDQCKPYHYGFSEKGCQKCECDPIGSKSPQCRENGQCDCLPNVEGRRCERCRENKFNRQVGCIDCPPCYGLIQDSVNSHRSKLNQLRVLLEEIQNSPAEVEDKTFESQLQELIDRTETLVLDARRLGSDGRNLVSSLSALKSRLTKVEELTVLVNNRMEGLNNLIVYGKQNMSLAEDLIDRTSSGLIEAKRAFELQGRTALESARERFARFGQQSSRMSQIALEVRALAERHEAEAENIEKITKEALNNSEEASKLVREAMMMHSSNREEIGRIQKQLIDIDDLLERTRKMAEEAKKEATRAAEDSLQLLTEAGSLSFPSIDSNGMKQDAKDLIEQARRIMREAEALLSRYENILNGTQIQMEDVRALLKEATRQQNIASGLLTEVDTAHKTAEKAAQAANSTLTEATKTLETLKSFDESVKESRDRAKESLKRVPQIEKLISEGTAKTKEAHDALSGAYGDAINAKSIALEARDIANNASSDAYKIRGEASTTKDRAQRMRGEADSLNKALDETEGRLNMYAEQTETDEKLALEALERANQAKTSASEAKNKVNIALDRVSKIIQTLDDMDSVNGTDMQHLELKLREAEKELMTADLNNRTEELRKSRDDLGGMLGDYRDMIDELRADVANIREIAYAIPTDCLRRSKLEP